MADIRRDIGMAKENWPPAIRAALLQPNAPNILFEISEIPCATEYIDRQKHKYKNIQGHRLHHISYL